MSRRILLVEDEPAIAEPLEYLLTREGYAVTVAADGRAALDAYARAGADLVLLDLMLPQVPGTEVARRLRSTSDVPIIMLTAKDMAEDQNRCIEAGANDYLSKPLDVDKLLSLTRVWMPR